MKIRKTVNQKTVMGMLTAVIIMFSLALVKNAVAMPPLNVGLISYTATAQNNAALLEWETASELGTAGFAIQRQADAGAFEDISGFIVSEGGVAVGSTYNFTDSTAVNTQTYTYRLIEYETSSNVIELGDRQVTIGLQPTATPITISGGGNNGNSNPTATPIATSTASPTATTEPTTTVTAQETAVSPTTIPTTQPTATATSTATTSDDDNTVTVVESDSDSSDTETRATESQNNDAEVVAIAQLSTPQPTTEAYPAETTTDSQPVGNDDYPADAGQSLMAETATPYPIAAETVNDANNDDTINVIGNDTLDSSSNVDTIDDNNGRFYLWFSFIVALFIFIAGLVGSAVLFTRKN